MPVEIQFAIKEHKEYIEGALINMQHIFSVESETDWGKRGKSESHLGYCRISDAEVEEMRPYFLIISEPGKDEPPKLVTGYRYVIGVPFVRASTNRVFTKAEFTSHLVDRVSRSARRNA